MRLIDSDALMREYARFVAPANNSDIADVPTWNDAVSLLGSAPTINVIHCKNCIHAKKGCYCEYMDRYMGLDDFCSRGKAKD